MKDELSGQGVEPFTRYGSIAAIAAGIATIAFGLGFLSIQPLQQLVLIWTRSPQFSPVTDQYAMQVTQTSQAELDYLSIQSLPVILHASLATGDRAASLTLNPLGLPDPNRMGFVADDFVATITIAPISPVALAPAAPNLSAMQSITMTAAADPYGALNLPRL